MKGNKKKIQLNNSCETIKNLYKFVSNKSKICIIYMYYGSIN